MELQLHDRRLQILILPLLRFKLSFIVFKLKLVIKFEIIFFKDLVLASLTTGCWFVAQESQKSDCFQNRTLFLLKRMSKSQSSEVKGVAYRSRFCICQSDRTGFCILFSWWITYFSDILLHISDLTKTLRFSDSLCPVRIVK